MSSEPMDCLLHVIDIAREAGRRILTVYERDFEVDTKQDESPLTAADMASHHHIVDSLRALTPDIPVLSEESDSIPFSERQQWSRYWLIDPLDGTREFIKRNGEFTVNIALIDQHEPVMGVILAPVTGELFYAMAGGSAWYQSASEPPRTIQCKEAEPTLVIAGSRSHVSDRMRSFLEALPDHELISLGSSLKFCYVAMGKADLYLRLGPTSEWDSAAAHCIVNAAGGQVCKTDFSPRRYNTKNSLLNPDFVVFASPRNDWVQALKRPAACRPA